MESIGKSLVRIRATLEDSFLDERIGIQWRSKKHPEKTNESRLRRAYYALQELKGFLVDAKKTSEVQVLRDATDAAWLQVEASLEGRAARVRAVNASLEAVAHLLPKSMTRRRFFGLAAMAATGVVAGGTLATLLSQKSPATERDSPESWKRGLYIQLGAYSSQENADRERALLAKRGVKSRSFQTRDERGPFKVLFTYAYQDFDEALRASIMMRDRLGVKEAGLVLLLPAESRTRWLKTVATRIAREKETLNVSSAEQENPVYWHLVVEATRRYATSKGEHVDPLFAWAIIRIESSLKPNAHSASGAMGLMQLMPRMWSHFHNRSAYFTDHKNKCNPYDPVQNIDAGVHMLTYLYEKYPRGMVVAPDYGREDIIAMAYNCGETVLNSILRDGLIEEGELPQETKEYAEKRRKVAMLNNK